MNNEVRQCLNCEAVLSGEYCIHCGQRERDRDIRMLDLAGEAFEDLTHLDSRLWRTLVGLMLHPGAVTADYLAGRRAAFIPPLRLYFIVSFLLFLALSFTGGGVEINTDPDMDTGGLELRESGIYVPTEGADGKTEVLTLDEYLEREGMLGEDGKVPAWLRPWLKRLADNAVEIEEDPGEFIGQLIQQLPQVMLLLLPLFALLLRLFYLLQPFHYLQHFVFSLHYHTAACLLLLLQMPFDYLLPGDITGPVMLLMLAYLPMAMARVYGSSLVGAWAKGLVLGVGYYMLLLTTGAIYILVSLALR